MQTLLIPTFKTATITAAAATSQTANLAPGAGDCFQMTVNMTAASGTSPTFDGVVQTSFDKGSNWISLPLRFTQFTTTGVKYLVFRNGLGNNEVALENAAADTGGTLAKNCIFDPQYLRLKYTIGGTSPSFTATVYLGVVHSGALAR